MLYLIKKELQETNGWLKPVKLSQLSGELANAKMQHALEDEKKLAKRQEYIQNYMKICKIRVRPKSMVCTRREKYYKRDYMRIATTKEGKNDIFKDEVSNKERSMHKEETKGSEEEKYIASYKEERKEAKNNSPSPKTKGRDWREYFNQEELINTYNCIVQACEGEKEEDHNTETDSQEEVEEQVAITRNSPKAVKAKGGDKSAALMKKKASEQLRKLVTPNCSQLVFYPKLRKPKRSSHSNQTTLVQQAAEDKGVNQTMVGKPSGVKYTIYDFDRLKETHKNSRLHLSLGKLLSMIPSNTGKNISLYNHLKDNRVLEYK